MKSNQILIALALAVSTGLSAQSGWTVVEANLGVASVQGEMQDNFASLNNFAPSFSLSVHHRASKSRHFSLGGSLQSYSLNQSYSGNKNWLEGHQTQGYGTTALVSARLLMTGRDDVRFMKGAFYAYLEGGVGATFATVSSTYPPPVVYGKFTDYSEYQSDLALSAGAAFGMQYYFTQNWGMNLRLSGMYADTDLLDGIEGITDTNDYLWSASLGLLFAF